jgi:hypothetical protein
LAKWRFFGAWAKAVENAVLREKRRDDKKDMRHDGYHRGLLIRLDAIILGHLEQLDLR